MRDDDDERDELDRFALAILGLLVAMALLLAAFVLLVRPG